HHGRDFSFGRDRRHGHRAWRQSGAEKIHLVIDDQFLRQPLGIVRYALVVFDDELDLLAGDSVAVLRNVELGRVGDLAPDGRRSAGHRDDNADFYGFLRGGAARINAGQCNREQSGQHNLAAHDVSSIARFLERVIERPGCGKCKRHSVATFASSLQELLSGRLSTLSKLNYRLRGNERGEIFASRPREGGTQRRSNYAAVVARPVLSRLSR